MRHRDMIVAGLVGVVLLAGCTSMSPGRAEPAPSTVLPAETTEVLPPSSAPSGAPLPSDGAPKVKNPLDVSRFQQDPCRALTPSQAQELNVPSSGTPSEEALGNACRWRNPETRGDVQLAFLDKNPRGLSGVYAANRAGKLAFFNEMSAIEGFPAVAYGASDDRKNGGCTVGIGVSDSLVFLVQLGLSQANVEQKDPCEVAVQVAGMMLRTMKAGG